MSRVVRVVKIGGSLLDLPDLPIRYQQWQDCQSPAINVLLAGGGKLAEEIRALDTLHNFGELRSHWMCVDLLAVTAQVLSAIFVDFTLLDSFTALGGSLQQLRLIDRITEPTSLIFSPADFLRKSESKLPGTPLPCNWDVTSDSIAARLAEVLAADELVLLKSTLLSNQIVDKHFAVAASKVSRVRLVSLRDESPTLAAFPPLPSSTKTQSGFGR